MSLVAELMRRSAMRNALALSGLFVVVLALCGVWLIYQISREVRADIDADLQLAHSEFSGASEQELRDWFRLDDELVLLAESYRTSEGEVLGTLRPEVFDTDGFQTLTADDLFNRRFLVAFDRLFEEISAETDLDLKVDTWRAFIGPVGSGQLAVFEPMSGVEDALEIIPGVILTVGVALVLTTLLAGAFLARHQQARLDRIRGGIARIGQGDLSRPIAPKRLRDDLDEIMKGVDEAAVKLDGSISRLRLFSQNVAHELRTPLARLRATLEDAPEPQEAALTRTDEVIRTLDAVHRIARLSHQPDPATLTQVPLAEVAFLAEDLFAEVAAEKGQRLHVVLENPAVVQGDFQLLAQLMSNLVENAIRYAGDGAEITVSACGAEFCVSDTGPGIVSDLDMTEPFARAAEARSKEGSGLGLALVKTIAHYHGAELTLASDGGLLAQVTFK